MIYRFSDIEPRWINFENPKGEKGCGGISNSGAKGHAFEKLLSGEEKVLCDFDGCGIIRRIWITLSDRTQKVLQNVYIKMFWDGAKNPQVNVPLGDFFCMGLGEMRPFENRFFSTAEGRSLTCTIPMPFFRHAKIVLHNRSGVEINNLFYDINLTLDALSSDTMLFCADFYDRTNALEEDIEILNHSDASGRFLGASIAVIPNDAAYGGLWWGEGEVKIYLDDDTEYPTLVGTGAEDYVGSAWELGEFINRDQGCVTKNGNSVSMYRFHYNDPVFFKENIKVTLQAMGGGSDRIVKAFEEKQAPYALVSYDDGMLHGIYKTSVSVNDIKGYTNFFRCDRYRTVAYYYVKSSDRQNEQE